MKRAKQMIAAPQLPEPPRGMRRVAGIPIAVAYGTKIFGGRFSRQTLYKLIRAKHVKTYIHLGRRLVDLDSIDRYVKNLPVASLKQRESKHD